MKYIALTSAATALLVANSYGDITFAAPGMESASSVTGTDIKHSEALGLFYEYEITGLEWQLSAGTPTGSDTIIKGNGDFHQGDTSRESTLTVTIAGRTILGPGGDASTATLTATSIYDKSSGTVTLSEPFVVKAADINLLIEQTSEMTGDGSSYVAIKGVCLKNPPVPVGDLEVSATVREGATPQCYWVIRREGVYGTAPSFSVTNASWSPGSSGSGSGGSSSSGSTDGSTEVGGTDAPNAAVNKTNNGHGNNIDGVDVSNPGKSAEKWAARGIIDESIQPGYDGEADDEGSGGGSAVSQQTD